MRGRAISEDPTLYRIEYARIAQLLHKESEPDRKVEAETPGVRSAELRGTIAAIRREVTDREEGLAVKTPRSEQALELLESTTAELLRLRWRWVGRQPPWYVRWFGWRHWRLRREQLLLGRFLDTVLEPATVALYFSCLIEEGTKPRLPHAARGVAPDRKRAISRRGRDAGGIDPAWLKRHLAYLCYGEKKRAHRWPLSRMPWLARWLDTIRSLGRRAGAWLGFTLWRVPAEPGYRARYNLACMFSRRAEKRGSANDLAPAVAQLRLCMKALRGRERIALTEWARRDPGLDWLRRERAGEFDEIVPKGPSRPKRPRRREPRLQPPRRREQG